MTYTLSQLNTINLQNLAILNKRYFSIDGKSYVGTKEGRLLLETGADNTTFTPTDSIDADNVQDAIEELSSSSSTLTQNHILVGNSSNVATDVAMSGEASILSTGVISLLNSAVIGKVLTGYVSGTGVISAADSILSSIQKLNGNIGALVTGVSSVNLLTGAVALTGTSNRIIISAANVFDIGSDVVTLTGAQALSNKTGLISQWTNDSGYLTSSGTIANAVNVGITDDVTTNAIMYPTWVTANSGNLPVKVTSTKLSFNPSTGSLTSTGNIISPQIYGSTAANGDLLIDGTSNGTKTSSYVNLQAGGGNVIVGATSLASNPTVTSFSVSKNIDGGTSANSIRSEGVIQSGVSTNARMFITFPSTVASAFTLTNLNHYEAFQGTFGAGSTVTNQYGFKVDATLIGATNNYGFHSSIAAGTNRWNIYSIGTAQNYLEGSVGIGVVPTYKLDVVNTTLARGIQSSTTLTTATAAFSTALGSIFDITPQSDISTAYAIGISFSNRGTQNITSTTAGLMGFSNTSTNRTTGGTLTNFTGNFVNVNNPGIGSTITNVNCNWVATSSNAGSITNWYGNRVDNQTITTTLTAAYHSAIAASSNRYNLYMVGTAQNYLAGNLGIGQIIPTAYLHIKANTATASTGAIKFSLPGVPLTTREAGVIETDAETIYYTPTSLARQAIGGTLFTQTADKTVTNTVTETSIVGTGVGSLATAMTLPANFFNKISKTLRLRIGGVYSTPALATPSIIVKVKFAGTTIATVTTTALLSGATNLEFDGEILITCRTTGATGTVMVHGDIEYATGIAGTIAVDPLNNAGATTTIDTTTASLLDVTVQWDTNTATRIAKSTVCTLEVLN